MSKLFLWALFILYLCLITNLILYKNYVGSIQYNDDYGSLTIAQNFRRANCVPFKTIWDMAHEGANAFVIQNIIGNLALFIPLGFLLPVLLPAFTSFVRLILVAFLLSQSYETIQLITVLGIFDIDDTILNTIGALIGFFIVKRFSLHRNSNSNLYKESP
jgi:glycopeptide antibiotics resistance protein